MYLLLLCISLLFCCKPNRLKNQLQAKTISASQPQQQKDEIIIFYDAADNLLNAAAMHLAKLEGKIKKANQTEAEKLQVAHEQYHKEYQRLNRLLAQKRKDPAFALHATNNHAFRNLFLVDLLELNSCLEELTCENPL